MQQTQEQSQDPSQSQGVAFSLGTSDQANQSQRVLNAEQKNEQRKAEVFGSQNVGESSKRGREEYAQSLRKARREQNLRDKRQNRAGAKPSGSETEAGQNFGQQQQQEASLGKVTAQIQITIQEALSQMGQLTDEQFIQLGNNLAFQLDQFEELVNLLTSGQQLAQILACIGMRKLLSREKDPPIQQAVDRNLIPRLLQFAQCEECPKLQFEGIWCLTNIASSESAFVLKLVENNAIQILMGVLDTSAPSEVMEQAIWCIGNISGDCVRFRDHMLEQGVMPKIVRLLHNAPPNQSFQRNASWAAANFFKGKPTASFELLKPAVPTLCKVVTETDNLDILQEVCWAFSYATEEGSEECIEVFLEPKFLNRLIQLLTHSHLLLQVPCLRVLGNILTSSDEYSQMVVDQGALRILLLLLDHPKKAILKEVCWSISNVTAGSAQMIQQCIDAGIMDKVIQMTISGEREFRLESIWCVANAQSKATPEQIQVMVQKGSLQAINAVIQCAEPKTICVALEGLFFILQSGQQHMTTPDGTNPMAIAVEQSGLIEQLEELQMSQNQRVYEKTFNLLQTFFTEADQNDIMSMLMTGNQQQQQQPAADSLWGAPSNNFNI